MLAHGQADSCEHSIALPVRAGAHWGHCAVDNDVAVTRDQMQVLARNIDCGQFRPLGGWLE